MALLQNVIMRGTHASRPAAGSQGLIYFESDTGQLFRDSGSAWQLVDPTSLFATKGDLLVGTGSGTVAKMAAGTDAYVLTADSAQTNGIKWAAAAGGTSVVKQILHAAQTADNTNISSVAIADYPNLSQAITVGGSGSNSVVVELSGSFQSSANSTLTVAIKLGSTTIYLGSFWSSGGNATGVHGIAAFDSVAAGAATVQPRYLSSGGGIYCRPITANPTQERMHLLVTEYAN